VAEIKVNKERLDALMAHYEAEEITITWFDPGMKIDFLSDLFDDDAIEMPEGVEAVVYALHTPDEVLLAVRPVRNTGAYDANIATYSVALKELAFGDQDVDTEAAHRIASAVVAYLNRLLPIYEKVHGGSSASAAPHPFEAFVRQVATLTKTRETLDGKAFEMENTDAFDTLHSLISEARELLGESSHRDVEERGSSV
jgi:hypothetical protein